MQYAAITELPPTGTSSSLSSPNGGHPSQASGGYSAVVCSGLERRRHIMTSRSSHVQMRVIPSRDARFLIKFEGLKLTVLSDFRGVSDFASRHLTAHALMRFSTKFNLFTETLDVNCMPHDWVNSNDILFRIETQRSNYYYQQNEIQCEMCLIHHQCSVAVNPSFRPIHTFIATAPVSLWYVTPAERHSDWYVSDGSGLVHFTTVQKQVSAIYVVVHHSTTLISR